MQILRWQHQGKAAEEPPSKKRRTRSSTAAEQQSNPGNTSTDDSSSRPQLALELQAASELSAALAVLQSLYAASPLQELLSKLSQEQQLQATILADKWQVPDVGAAAVDALSQVSK